MRPKLLFILCYVPLVHLLHMLDEGVLLPLFLIQFIELFGHLCDLHLLRVESIFSNLNGGLIGVFQKFSLELF